METVNRILQEKITARIAPNKAVTPIRDKIAISCYYIGFKNTHNWLFNNKRQLRLFFRQQIYMATYPIIQKTKGYDIL